jgi:hypothetical protein
MKTIRIILTLIVVLSTNLVSQAQIDTTIFTEIVQKYTDQKNIYLEIQSKVYEGSHSTDETIRISKAGEKYRYETKDAMILFSLQNIIIVDDRNLNIICMKRTKEQFQRLIQQNMLDVNHLLEKYPAITLEKEKITGKKYYHLYGENEQISDIHIYINEQKTEIDRCTYRYNPKVTTADIWLEVIYKVVNTITV